MFLATRIIDNHNMIKALNTLPFLVVSNKEGYVFEVPELQMAGARLQQPMLPLRNEIIPMPFGSILFTLPGRSPMGYDPIKKRFTALKQVHEQPVYAVGAFMAPAYSQLYLAAYKTQTNAPTLPLFAYTAVGWQKEGFFVAGMRVDDDIRQDPAQFNQKLIAKRALQTLKRYPNNRLVAHLFENCVKRYHCPAAQNFVMGRWEAPIPTSPACNANCVGCISKQSDKNVPVTQERILFIPTVEEIVEYAVPHLQTAPCAIVSFGQGCEGEPLLQGDLIEESIRAIRKQTDKGTINLNTNACYPDVVKRLCEAGLDSIRVSLNSAQPELYKKYYSPRDYSFDDVQESMAVVRKYKRWISINYFIFPGLTDHPQEIMAFTKMLIKFKVDYVQMRNLNIDPEHYIHRLQLDRLQPKAIGILQWLHKMQHKAPWFRYGYYNPPKENW